MSNTDRIVDQVVNKFQQRSDVGIKKYGTTLYENNHDNYLLHLQEELQDATLYIEKLLTQGTEIINLVKTTSNDAELGKKIRELVR
jgi:hypothetical protein